MYINQKLYGYHMELDASKNTLLRKLDVTLEFNVLIDTDRYIPQGQEIHLSKMKVVLI